MNINNEIDALKEQIAILEKKQEEALKPKPRTGRINCVSELTEDDTYYVLTKEGVIEKWGFRSDVKQQLRIVNQGNAAWDRATLERQAKLNELNTRARAASAKAGVIDLRKRNLVMSSIYWDFNLNKWDIEELCNLKNQGGIHFPNIKSAKNFMKSLTPDEQRLFAGGDV